jgi:hypothetical protein
MSTLVPGTITSPTTNQRYGFSFDSLQNAMLKPQVENYLIKRYGKGVGILEFARWSGATISIPNQTREVFEEGSLVKTVVLNGPIAITAMGLDITFSIAAAEYDLQGSCYLNTNDIIVIPAEYMQDIATQALMPHEYQITGNDGGLLAARVYTAKPKLITSHVHIAVPTGTALMVTGGNYSVESASGSVKSSGWYHRAFYLSIKKHDWGYGGGTISKERYYEGPGQTSILTKNTIEADFFLDKYVNDEIWLSPGLTNPTFTQVNRLGTPILATATVGLLKQMVDRAMKQYYTTAYQASDFDDIKDLLISQGIVERDVTFFMGSSLYKQIENSGLDFIKEFSGGTDFMVRMNEIGVAFRAINKNGVYTTFKEVPSFSDPTSYGASAFKDYFKDLGFLIPTVDVTVNTGTVESPVVGKIKNFTLGFVNFNGENRTRIVKDLPSVAGQGNIAIDTWDDSYGTMLTHFMVIANGVNQWVLCLNDNIFP